MSSKRPSSLGPGGKLILSIIIGIAFIFILWSFVINPIFLTKSNSNANASANSTANSSSSNNGNNTSSSDSSAKPVLTGQVVDASSGTGVANATITNGQTTIATTDSTGKFQVTQQVNSNQITITAPGYASVTVSSKDASAIQLNPVSITGTLVDADTQKPLGGMPIRYDDVITNTDKDGNFTLSHVADGGNVVVSLFGYGTYTHTINLSQDKTLSIAVHSTDFNGTIVDSETGKPVSNAYLTMGNETASGTYDGKFYFANASDDNATIKVRAPGYKIQTFKLSDVRKGIKLVPFHFSGVYVPGIFAIRANYNDLFVPYLQMADKHEINAIVVGVKDDDTGELFYDSQLPLAKQYNLIYNGGKNSSQLIDIQNMLKDAHKHGLYVVARFVVTRDPHLAQQDPAIAVHDTRTGGLWKDNNSGLNWINPTSPQEVQYVADLSKELSQLGFDEVQLDYIRFPADPPLKYADFGNGKTGDFVYDDPVADPAAYTFRTQAIDKIVKTDYDYLKTTDTFLSLDVFGVTLWRVDDNNIGQQYNDMIMYSDYICPMVYPSHFLPGTLNYDDPGNHPKEIIAESNKYAELIQNKLHPVATYRPWLEDFDYPWGAHPYTYTPAFVKIQIDTADSSPVTTGWTLWNAVGKYTNSVLDEESSKATS